MNLCTEFYYMDRWRIHTLFFGMYDIKLRILPSKSTDFTLQVEFLGCNAVLDYGRIPTVLRSMLTASSG
jgi:hypothetical protein